MPTKRDIEREISTLRKPAGLDVDDLPGYTITRMMAVSDPDRDLEVVWFDEETGIRKLSNGQLCRPIDLGPAIDAASRGDDSAD